ncbi:MAG: hypothetical protein EOP47_05065 [Sphingobacteriaceae bacterium]|nr:MAG: hypothetical protein EOP47_05065 [Sphingobacteriaceae bacterium]
MSKITLHLFSFLSIMICVSASAQKLPAIQPNSIKPPANLKIDGKTNEWNNTFQAYNGNIDAFYSISNDDSNLYLVVKTKDETTAKKMIGAGIVLSITPEKNKFENGCSIGPAVNESATLTISNAYMEFKQYAGKKDRSKQADSSLTVVNKAVTTSMKEIIVAGVTGIDNVIPVYNEQGIRSAMLFDNSGALTWEFAVPLKYLKSAMGNKPSFFYNLIVRGMRNNAKSVTSRSTGVTAMVVNTPRSMGTSNQDQLMNTTDFWGEYKLAK